MRLNQPDLRLQLFLVRMWVDPQDDGRIGWQGKVQHLTSGEAHRFGDWATLIAMLQQMLPDPHLTNSDFPDDKR